MASTDDSNRYLSKALRAMGWNGVSVDNKTGDVNYKNGVLLESLDKDRYELHFIYRNTTLIPEKYTKRKKYASITFPKSLHVEKFLTFGRGSYNIKGFENFKKIINNTDKECLTISITDSDSKVRRFIGAKGDRLVLSKAYFLEAIKDAESVKEKASSYKKSVANYLARENAKKYSDDFAKNTTFAVKGEASFYVKRLNLATKDTPAKLLRYLDDSDLDALENVSERLIKLQVFSKDFLRKLNNYFIKENLEEIIQKGRMILKLRSSNMDTDNAQRVLSRLDYTDVKQMEGLWQKYFEDYLLYLIFSYKKIFPKIELTGVDSKKRYPDFIGINHYNGLDVIEIKTHLKHALQWDKSHENYYFSGELSKAIIQTRNYMDAIVRKRFEKSTDEKNITDHIEAENLYHPRGVIIISQKSNLTNHKNADKDRLERDFTKLRNSLQDIQILTFDEVIQIADEYSSNILDRPEEESD